MSDMDDRRARQQAQDETGCGECGVERGEPCRSDCTADPEPYNSPWQAQPWVIVCANGDDHRDYGVGKVSGAAYEQAARDAAEFMDAERESSPWTCGPHTTAPARTSSPGSGAESTP